MIPIKVPNLELSSGKLPAAYRIDPVMLGNPWHGLVRVDNTGNVTLETRAGVTKSCKPSTTGGDVMRHVYGLRFAEAPGLPGWFVGSNPDPVTGKEYVDYILVSNDAFGFSQIPKLRGSKDGSTFDVEFDEANGWLIRGDDGRNWRVEATPSVDTLAGTARFDVTFTPWWTIENGVLPPSQTISITTDSGGSTISVVCLIALSESGKKAAFVAATRQTLGALWELTVGIDASGTAHASAILVQDEATSLGTLNISSNLIARNRKVQFPDNITTDPDTGDIITTNTCEWVDAGTETEVGDNLMSMRGYVSGTYQRSLTGQLIGAYYAGDVLKKVVYETTQNVTFTSVENCSTRGYSRWNSETGYCFDNRIFEASLSEEMVNRIVQTISDGSASASVVLTETRNRTAAATRDFSTRCSTGSTTNTYTESESGGIETPLGAYEWNLSQWMPSGYVSGPMSSVTFEVAMNYPADWETNPQNWHYRLVNFPYKDFLGFGGTTDDSKYSSYVFVHNNHVCGRLFCRGTQFVDLVSNPMFFARNGDPANLALGPFFAYGKVLPAPSVSWSQPPNAVRLYEALHAKIYFDNFYVRENMILCHPFTFEWHLVDDAKYAWLV